MRNSEFGVGHPNSPLDLSSFLLCFTVAPEAISMRNSELVHLIPNSELRIHIVLPNHAKAIAAAPPTAPTMENTRQIFFSLQPLIS